MGTGEILRDRQEIRIHSHIITYGGEANPFITEQIRQEIESMWNEPGGLVTIKGEAYRIIFRITAEYREQLSELEVFQNLDPRNNYFRIEAFSHNHISFVDALGCNSGYFILENLYEGSTTAAHEYGHTLGLEHPDELDIRGKGQPGIMYPRGTLVDPAFQYDPAIAAGEKGGTLHPRFRKVLQQDTEALKLHRLRFENDRTILGEFTNVFHYDHAGISRDEFFGPPPA